MPDGVSKAEVLRQLKPCIICGNQKPIVRENVDFIRGTVNSIWQVLCAHKGQRPALWYELRTKWSDNPQDVIDRWNAL